MTPKQIIMLAILIGWNVAATMLALWWARANKRAYDLFDRMKAVADEAHRIVAIGNRDVEAAISNADAWRDEAKAWKQTASDWKEVAEMSQRIAKDAIAEMNRR